MHGVCVSQRVPARHYNSECCLSPSISAVSGVITDDRLHPHPPCCVACRALYAKLLRHFSVLPCFRHINVLYGSKDEGWCI